MTRVSVPTIPVSSDVFSDYLVTVQYEVDGTRYTADLSLGQAFFTGNRVARAGADGLVCTWHHFL